MSTTLPHSVGPAPPVDASTRPDTPTQPAAALDRAPAETRTLCRSAAASFSLGLVGLRLCWLPGINCVLAAAAIILGAVALWQILRSRGAITGIDEAVSGMVLGVVSLGLSVFFLSLLIAAWR